MNEADLEWLESVRWLALHSVKFPESLLQRLPNLEALSVVGATGADLDFLRGCQRLRHLCINQITGVTDVTAIRDLIDLEFLSLYGLPRVPAIPNLAPLVRLRRIELGSMKGLEGLTGALEAPRLTDLVLIRAIGLASHDAQRIVNHTSLARFTWFAEDVPDKVWVPFVESVGKPKASPLGANPRDWFEEQ